LVKISINRFVSRRVENIRKEVEASTQRLRKKTLKHLEEIFTMAARVARGEIKHQRIDGRMVRITLNQRRRWLRVAEQSAKTINNIATNIDEQEIYIQLDKLARLVNEANTKAETGKPMKLGKQKE
jgi:methionyl-tRNA synthetase